MTHFFRYYFSATDAASAVVTLPIDAPVHTFTATVLPAVFTPTAACPGDTARVLYVNAFAGSEGGTGVDQSLAALGIRYDRFDVNEAASGLGNTPGGGDPAGGGVLWPGVSAASLAAMYSAVIWDVGERSSLTLSAQDQALLSSWLGTLGKNRGLDPEKLVTSLIRTVNEFSKDGKPGDDVTVTVIRRD